MLVYKKDILICDSMNIRLVTVNKATQEIVKGRQGRSY